MLLNHQTSGKITNHKSEITNLLWRFLLWRRILLLLLLLLLLPSQNLVQGIAQWVLVLILWRLLLARIAIILLLLLLLLLLSA